MSSFLAGRTARWSIGAVALCLVLTVAAWFLLISPRLEQAAGLQEQTLAADDQAALLEIKLLQLKDQAADLPEQKKKIQEIARELPPDADVPEYLRTLDTISSAAGVNLKSVTPGAPVLVTLAPSGPAGAPPATTDVLGSPGDLVSLPMNVELSGTYYQLSSWLKSLQTKVSRSYLVSAFSLTSNTESGGAGGLLGARIDGVSLPADGNPAPTSSVTPSAVTSSSSTPSATASPTVTPTDTSVVIPPFTGGDATGSGTDGSGSDGSGGSGGTGVPEVEVDPWSLSLTGTVFVLLSEDSTLEDIKRDAAAAQAALSGTWTEPVPAPAAVPSATSTVAATDPNAQVN